MLTPMILTACVPVLYYLYHLSLRLTGPRPRNSPDISEEALSRISYDDVDIRKGIPMEATFKGYIVVGGSGFVGSCIVKLLLLRGETNIQIIDLQEPPKELMGLPSVTWTRTNLTNAAATRTAIIAPFPSTGRPAEVIYYTAAIIRFWERANYCWDTSYRINVLGMRNVLDAVKSLPSAILVFTSSAGVAEPTPKLLRLKSDGHSLISDDSPMPPLPENCYYRSKRLAEELVKEANREIPHLNAAILRPGYTIIGPNDRKLCSTLLLPRVPVWDARWGSTDVCVWDCAAAHLCCEDALSRNPEQVAGEAFLITGEHVAWSLGDVRSALKHYAARDIKLDPVPPLLIYIVSHFIEAFLFLRYYFLLPFYSIRGMNPSTTPRWMGEVVYLQPTTLNYFKNTYIDDSRARRLLGYRPQWGLAQCIRYTVDQVESNTSGETKHGLQLKQMDN